MKQRTLLLASLLAVMGLQVRAEMTISEFMASNSKTLADDFGNYEDWIELYNSGPTNVNLYGWSLTDAASTPTKWQFPSTNLAPGSYMVIFASDRNRRMPGAVLHTNFKLSADGEYLALVRPDGSIATQFAPNYPAQKQDVSFGPGFTTISQKLLTTGAVGRVKVPLDSSLGLSWTTNGFNHASWTIATNGIGYETGGATNYTGLIKSDVRTAMQNVNASVYFRLPFNYTNAAPPDSLTLRMKFNDGFAAYVNGLPAASANAPLDPEWNDAATAANAPANAAQFAAYDLSSVRTALVSGTNTLALQGLNLAASDADFLSLAELEWASSGYHLDSRYFILPTPGAVNGTGTSDLGPILKDAAHFPITPATNQSLTVTCRVMQAFGTISNVTLRWRVMFGVTNQLPMYDDGAHADGAAGDGVYGATIPSGSYAAGQMVRWFITATDSLSHTSRWPLFENPTNSAEYLGTVVQPNYVTSKLPILHLFAPANVLQPGAGPGGSTSQIGADSESGGRVSVFYDGEFYDNIYMELRGNTTAVYYKKSHRLEFNKERPFRHPGPGGRIRKTSFVADFADTTYMRQGLSFWICALAGAPAPFYEPWRLQLNGAFYQLANHNDVHGEELLERLGYDPEGALYNAAGIVTPSRTTTGGFDMKTREWSKIDAYAGADYYTLANAISESLTTAQRRTNIFDLLDLPEVINYMVAARFVHENDDVWANMSLYHDNDGDGLWRIIPFDMNLSWGAAYVDSGGLVGIQATNDSLKSHPLYGSSQTIWNDTGNWNRMYDVIFQVPQTREMFLRRMRTFLDTWVKPPGTPTNQLPIEAKVLAWRDQIAEEAMRDRNWWGWAPDGGQNNLYPDLYITNGVNELLTNFLAARRQHFYGKHNVTNTALPIGISKASNAGIPAAQPSNAVISILSWDYNPASGNQDEEFICVTNANNYAVDISGWKLGGGVIHTVRPGTVIPAQSALYLTPNARAFRARTVAPKGGMGLFVQGGYDGHLNAWGEDLTLADQTGRLVSSNSFVGAPSDVQRYLRVTEIMYNPSPAPAITNDAQLFEYVELRNIATNVTLNLANVRFTNGIHFNFTGSAVTSLSPGQRVLIVRSQAAFTARYGSGPLIAGEFSGTLDNGDESLRLEDAVGEKVLEFAYNDAWYPITDGLGFSLVIVDDHAHWSTWDNKASWRPSGVLDGSPGAADAFPTIAPILVNEVLAHTDLPDVDSVELFNPTPTNVNIGGWFLTDDIYTPKKYRIANGTMIPAGGYLVFNANQFGSGANAFLFSEYGEAAWLLSGDATTNLTGYAYGFDFPESPNGVSFGRHVNSQTNTMFVLQSTNTLGASNAAPRVGPLVISEIMYHPPDLPGAVDNDLDEFIELQNISAATVPLWCVFTNEPGYGLAARTNTWRLRDAVDFDFPTNVSLAAGARLIVVGFDPSTNAAQLAAFRSLYSVPTTVPVFGPWSGKLDNRGETIELKWPDKPDVTTNVFVPYIMAEKVNYTDAYPWPAGADGLGNSLQRRILAGFGNDPTNWFAASPSAGQINAPNNLPWIVIASPSDGTSLGRHPAITLTASATDPDGTVVNVSYYDGTTLLGSSDVAPWTFQWTNAAPGLHTLTARAVDDGGAVAQSTAISIIVTSMPPTVSISAPAPWAVFTPETTIAVTASASDPDGTVAAVEFHENGTLLTTITSPPYSFNWIPSATGYRTLSAIARDNGGTTSTPATVTVFVRQTLASPTVISAGATWRYLDNGVSQGTSWIAPGFDDSSWSTGPAKLGFNNNGNSGIATQLSYGASSNNKYPAYYFRKPFVVPSLTGMTNLLLEVMRDDGVIVYLNGAEIYRNNLPPGPIPYTQLATNCSDQGNTWQVSTTPVTGLVLGTNVIAAEVHQSSLSSSDTAFDLRLTLLGTAYGPAITTQPQSVTTNLGADATFSVTASGNGPLALQWRHEGTNLPAATAASFTLTNLSAPQAGDYLVVVTNFVGAVTSQVATLTLLNPDSDGDGMPDAWEVANGLSVGINDADLDADADGMSNFKEYISHTDPQNTASVLKLVPGGSAGGTMFLNFTAQAGVGYTVQASDTLPATNWQTWLQVVPAPTNRTVTITNATPFVPQRFFRVVTPPVP